MASKISREEVDEFLKEMREEMDFFDSKIYEFQIEVAYLGFNAKTTATEFLKKGSKRSPKDDLKYLVMLFHERGSNITKILKKTGEVGKEKINKLRQVYSIQDNAKTATPTTLTLPRIALTFPVQSVAYCMNYRVNDPIGNELPSWSKTQAFASLIPNKGLKDGVKDVLIAVHLKAMEILTTKISKPGTDVKESINFYLKLGMENSLLSDAQRVQALIDLRIVDTAGELIDQSVYQSDVESVVSTT